MFFESARLESEMFLDKDMFFDKEMFFDKDACLESEIFFERAACLESEMFFERAAFLDTATRLATGLLETETPEFAVLLTAGDFLVDSRLLINDFFWIAMIFIL
ncbi:hypothetical protein [Granulicella sp. S190]|uniref:hypothetical protein n=1 Tax=Granulicella sp. S190 TaxID=1747226 RepID=UPI00131E3335|nr:hypothetical protein [Granulicella sp. S190]